MQTEKHISSYENFLSENRKRINEQFNKILMACVAAGPLIALAVWFHLFAGVTYLTALSVSVFMLALTVVHRILLKRHADSILTCMIAFFAIDILLVFMDSAHLTIFISWFLIPLLSLQFCDYKLYSISVVVNYFFMVFATWHMAPYFAERRTDVETPLAYFLSRLGGLTIEMIVMIAAGYSLCKITMHYYKSLIEQTGRLDEEHKVMERLNGQISSIADIYMYVCEINLTDNSYYEIQTDDTQKATYISERKEDAQKNIIEDVIRYVSNEYVESMEEFFNLYTLDSRIKNAKTISTEFVGTDGMWRRARFIVSGRYDDGRISQVINLVEDIDAEKKRRDALIDMSERAIAASEAKSAFLSNMSHEIRTPINAVLGMNEMILRESREKDILEYAENIRAAGNSLLGLINDILDFSKIEAGKMELNPVEYDMSSVINDLVHVVQMRADTKGLSLTFDFDSDMPRFLFGDEIRIKQVISNILTNAAKYTEKGGITFSMGYASIPGDRENVYIKVSVKDTGIGIKSEDKKRLFTEFERIEESRNRSIEGTGLGLNITKSLLEMMGSTLQIESVYGEGSRFFFSLRQQVVKWEPLGDYEASYRSYIEGKKSVRRKITAPEAKVLMVDDNTMNLVVFRNLLKQTGIKVDTAESGAQGLELTGEKKYDIIFLDHMMPHKDGIETLHELKAMEGNPNRHTTTVCLTANAILGAKEQYLAEGFDDYLTKPIDTMQLEDMLVKYLPEDLVTLTEIEEAGTLTEVAGDDGDDPEKELPDDLGVLKDQSLIDVGKGITNSGSPESYRSLLKIFYESLDDKLAEIEGFYNSDNIKDYTIKVHALKSSARLIGATALGEEAQSLEDAGKANDVVYIFENHEAFINNCKEHAALLRPIFGDESEEPVDKPLADEAVVKDILQCCRVAAEAMDCDGLETALLEAKKYSFTPEDKELIGKIAEAADNFDYNAVSSLLG